MALAEFLKEPAPASVAGPAAKPVDPAAKLRQQVFLEFGAMVALGLLLAGWYVAYRIVAGRGTSHAAAPAQVTFARPPVTPAPKVVPTQVVSPQVVSQPVPAPSIPAVTVHAEALPALPVAQPVTKSTPLPPPSPVLHETKPATVPAAVIAAPKLSEPGPVPQAVKRKETIAQQPFKRRDLSPRAGEKYLQMAAYGPRSLDGYLKTLEKQGMHPLVGPGPSENIYRILIGPLPDAEALEQTRRLIQSLGIEPILRSY